MARIRHASIHDVGYVGPRLRAADVEEIRATTGERPTYALLKSYTVSTWVKVAVDDQDFPVAMFGLCALNDDFGIPWMLVTDDFNKIIQPFRRQCRGVVADMQRQCRILHNYVQATNVTAQRWLRWCGFTVDPIPQPYGHLKQPFFPFTRIRSV